MNTPAKTYPHGSTVTLAGIDFVVLDDFKNSDGSTDLFILAKEAQGKSVFGDDNNYAESDLRVAVNGWCDALENKIGHDVIKTREISLQTLDGYNGYGDDGKLTVKAAPLTLDEARRYASIMPNPDCWCWLATGWGAPEHIGSTRALGVGTSGGWYYNYCSLSYGIRPALIVPSSLFDPKEDDCTDEDAGPDLSNVSTTYLLDELRRRAEK